MITDSKFTGLELGITCAWSRLESKECILQCNIKGVIWNDYSFLSSAFCVCLFCGIIGLV
jgi:hypothetical protein